MATATTAGTTPAAGGRVTDTRAHVQGFGTFLSGMIMPNIGAFIAWGLITAFFIEAGFTPFGPLGGFGENAEGEPHTGLVGPMITYLLPLLIAYTGGWKVHDVRGGVVGAMATMGVIVGTGILAAVMAICGLFPVGPAVLAFSNAAAAVVDFLATRGCAVLPPRGRSSPSSPRPPPTATWASPSP